jgi:predicted aldo/keto reductase-like oxidoreductase
MIPACFELYNSMHMFGNIDAAKFSYAVRMSGELSQGQAGYASRCVQCGECLEKCPQAIQIPDCLEQVANEMEGPDLETRRALGRQMLRIEAK